MGIGTFNRLQKNNPEKPNLILGISGTWCLHSGQDGSLQKKLYLKASFEREREVRCNIYLSANGDSCMSPGCANKRTEAKVRRSSVWQDVSEDVCLSYFFHKM